MGTSERPGAVRRQGALTLRLRGPAGTGSFSAEGSAPRWVDGEPSGSIDPLDHIVGGTVVDSNDLEWEIIALDRVKLEALVNAYDQRAGTDQVMTVSGDAPDSGEPSEPDTGSGTDSFDVEDAGWEEYTYQYDIYDCSSPGYPRKKWVWWGTVASIEGEVETFDDYQDDPVVRLSAGDGQCSGTLIDENTVLTAAHCLYNRDGDPPGYYPLETVEACLHEAGGLVRCAGAIDRALNPDWLSSGAAKDDWAVVNLDADLAWPDAWMGLSTTSDAIIRDLEWPLLSGYPGIPAGGEASCLPATGTLHLSTGGRTDVINTKSVLTDTTHGNGYSGGPMSKMGSVPSGRRYVYAVHAVHYHDPVNWAAKGPKIPYWRDAIIAMMD
jgi:hypothetical protein